MQATNLPHLLDLLHRQLMTYAGPVTAQVLTHRGLTASQVRTLAALSESTPTTGELSMSRLAEDLGLTLPTTSRSVASLVDRGLVDSREHPTDARQRVLEATPAGYELLLEIRQAKTRAFAVYADSLPGEHRTQLEACLGQVFADDGRRAGSTEGDDR